MRDFLTNNSDFFQGIHVIDIFCLSFILLGLLTGLKKGGYDMLLSFMKWLAGLSLASVCYIWIGGLISDVFNFDISRSLTLTFLGVNLLIWLVVILNEDFLKSKIKDSNAFNDIEETCGGLLGILTSFLILVFAFSLLHGNRTTDAAGQASERKTKATFGAVVLPNVYRIKKVVFEETFFGQLAKDRVPLLLVSDTYESVRARETKQ